MYDREEGAIVPLTSSLLHLDFNLTTNHGTSSHLLSVTLLKATQPRHPGNTYQACPTQVCPSTGQGLIEISFCVFDSWTRRNVDGLVASELIEWIHSM
jgi:hypothetical protein